MGQDIDVVELQAVGQDAEAIGCTPGRMLSSFRLHREALKQLVDRSVHDQPEIWYMRDDGSNLDDNVHDLTTVVLSDGLDLVDRYHDPNRVIEMIDDGSLLNPESPRAFYLRQDIVDYLAAAVPNERT